MKKQLNIRVSETTAEWIDFLAEQYGSKTQVIEVAVALLYTQFVNELTPGDEESRGGTPDPVVGKTYTIKHSRKGTFVARVVNDVGDFIDVEMLVGEARYISDYNAVPGEVIRIRKKFCAFSPK